MEQTQQEVTTRIARLIKVKKDLIKAGLSINTAGIISGILIRCNSTLLSKVLEVINQLKPN